MKTKLKSIFLSLVVMLSVFGLASCKKDSPPDTRVQPTASVEIENREFYANDLLSSIELWVKADSTEGTVEWVNPSQILVVGENACEWKFVPTDKTVYFEKTGTATITAVEEKTDPVVNVSISSQNVYAENKLSSANLAIATGDTAGTVYWVYPDQELVVGEQQCKWIFVPTDTATYKTIVGKIAVDAVAQTVVELEVTTAPTTTDYKPFQNDITLYGMALKATYDGGKVETVTSGWTVSYQNGTAVTMADTKLIVTYKGCNVDVEITVSKIGLNNPNIEGTYVYSGEPQTAVLKTNYYSKYYDVSNATYTDAGTHKITLTINDYVNFKWKNSATAVLEIDFVIQKADLGYTANDYSGVFDGDEHSISVETDEEFEVYYSTTQLTAENYGEASTSSPAYTNAGEYTIYFYIVGGSNYFDATATATVSIAKASQQANVQYGYAIVCDTNANIPSSYVTSYDIDGEAFDLTDKISFKYFSNYNTGSLTTSASGATTEGGAPKNIGTYSVETIILGNENYEDAVVVSTLVIAPKENFLKPMSTARQFAWLSSDENVYAEATTRTVETFNEFVLKIRIDETKSSYRAYQQTGKWFVELDEVYEISYDEANETISLVGKESGEKLADLVKWELPYYIGVFERDTVTTDDTTPNSTMTIYNDYGVIKFTFTYYAVNGSEVATATKTGTVDYIQGTGIIFDSNGTQNIEPINVDLTEMIDTLDITYRLPIGVDGEYARVS